MKKQILFLFAATSLFAACSSDDLPVNNGTTGEGDNGQTVVENLPSSASITTEEGLGMRVGALNNFDADTKATTPEVYFTVEIPDDILSQWEDYVVEADDFAIRIDGEYKKVKPVESSNAATWNNLYISGSKLAVQAEGLQADYSAMTEDGSHPEVTFECYLWIENKKPTVVDGKESFVERFTWNDKLNWINHNGDVTEKTERGYDVTKIVENNNGAVLHEKGNGTDDDMPEKGYVARYSVYRGLQGQSIDQDGNPIKDGQEDCGLGNTPYVKVSIHVNKYDDPDMDVDSQVIPVYPKED